MSKAGNCKICLKCDNNGCCVSVKHMISLSKCLLTLIKSTKWLFKDPRFRRNMVRELIFNCSISLTDRLLSDCILLYSSKAQGSALIAFTENESRTYSPSNVVTLIKAV